MEIFTCALFVHSRESTHRFRGRNKSGIPHCSGSDSGLPSISTPRLALVRSLPFPRSYASTLWDPRSGNADPSAPFAARIARGAISGDGAHAERRAPFQESGLRSGGSPAVLPTRFRASFRTSSNGTPSVSLQSTQNASEGIRSPASARCSAARSK